MTVRTLGRLDDVAAAALEHYDFSPATTATLINVSENATFRVDDPADGRRAALRVHRPGYRSHAEIASELQWLEALGADGVVEVPGPIRASDGTAILSVPDSGGGPRHVVVFTWLDGEMPAEDDRLLPGFRGLGRTSAILHDHSCAWRRPAGFRRNAWDHATTLGAGGLWGRWQDGLGIGTAEAALLTRLDRTIEDRLRAYGTGPDRFGLVHADLRLANLLVEDDRIKVIDFDDSGFSWFAYDFAAAVSFIEDRPDLGELREAWLEGYREVRPLPAEDEAEIDTMVMLRRLLLVAWIGSHHEEAPEAAALGAGFSARTCDLAERYLGRMG